MSDLRDRVLSYLALPVAAPQALWVRWRASRMGEAAGPRSGAMGSGPELRLLILGDSSAAGVGAATQEAALAGGVLRRLGAVRRVEWRLEATTGHTTRDALARLGGMTPQPWDVVLICLGVNDAKNGVRQWLWARRMTRIFDRLQQDFGARLVVISGLPPVGQFPLLPWPLRAVLGARVARFDRALARMAARREGVIHVPPPARIDPADMAVDGFHAGPRMYDIWAGMLVAGMMPHLPAPDTSGPAPGGGAG